MAGSTQASGHPSVKIYTVVDDSVNLAGNPVIYAQRYDAGDHAAGAAIRITSPAITAYQNSVLLLSNGNFVVEYNYFDPNGQVQLPFQPIMLETKEIATDDTVLATNSLGLNDYNVDKQYRNVALSDGAYAYVLDTYEYSPFGAYTDTKTLSVVDSDGQISPAVTLEVTSGGDGPFPRLNQSLATLFHLSDNRFIVRWTDAYTPDNPNFPSPVPPPAGERHFDAVYRDDGTLTTKITVDFDGSRLVETFDPASGRETNSRLARTDGSHVATEFGIAGRSYTDQSITTDADGRIIGQERHYGDGTLAFSLVNAADGTSEVHQYDTAGREVTRLLGDPSGEHDVLQYAYQGAATNPSTTVQTHYGPDNTRQSVDRTEVDGSHTQTASAAGVTLVSHAGVSDSFKAFAGGSDAFVFEAGFGKDVVRGFEPGSGPDHDVLRVDDALVSTFADLQAKATEIGTDTLITFDASNTILLKGVEIDHLVAGNVQFFHHGVLMA